MTTWGTVLIDGVGLVLIVWLFHLTRLGRLYVGYSVAFLITIAGAGLLISVPDLLQLVTKLMGAEYPASALTLLALGFFMVMLIYMLVQITTLSNRLATVVQELAVRQVDRNRDPAARSTRN